MTDDNVDLDTLAEELYIHMLTHGFVWKFEDGERTPEPSEISVGIERLIEMLKDEPNGTGVQGGRIYINKQEGVYDVYVHYGGIPDPGRESL